RCLMPVRRLRSVLATAFLALVIPVGLRAQEPVTVIRAARVLDGTVRTIPNATIVVRGARIVSVGPNTAVPAGARVYDLGSLTVLPGIISPGTSIPRAVITPATMARRSSRVRWQWPATRTRLSRRASPPHRASA